MHELRSHHDAQLKSKCCLKLGEWQQTLIGDGRDAMVQVLNSFHLATQYDPSSYKAWHAWALSNYQVVSQLERLPSSVLNTQDVAGPHLKPAIQGFFRSISLGRDRSLQDILRLLTLWFKYGARPDVEAALIDGFNSISIDTWLDVVPQLIARIHSPQPPVRRLIHELLTRVGRAHPQALVYPLTVASKSPVPTRKEAAIKILDKVSSYFISSIRLFFFD
jgi:FKBP12-rapamycin complex-associated protein